MTRPDPSAVPSAAPVAPMPIVVATDAASASSPSVSAAETRRGFILVALGVMVFVPDALVMRLVDIDAFAMAVCRGVFGGLVMTLGCVIAYGRALPAAIRALGPWGIALAGLEAASTVLFCLSIAWTSVANAMLAFAATPMLAALIARVALGERIPAQTAAAIAATVAGLGLVAFGTWTEGGLGFAGLAAGLLSALTIALFFVLLRVLKANSAAPVIGPGWLLGAVIALPFATFEPMTAGQWIGAFATGGVILPLAITLVAWGSRSLPAAETSMMTLLEVVAGPILVWAVIGEFPGAWTLAGGAVVLAALTLHSLWRLRGGAGRAAAAS